MILEIIYNVLSGLVNIFVSLLPTYAVPSSANLSALSAANVVLPIDVWLQCIGYTIAIMQVGLSFYAVKFIYNAVRGSGA